MLTNSYIHRARLPESKLKQILEGISTSKEKLNARDHWTFPHYNEITMIGVHSSNGTKVFINGIDLEYFPQALKGCKVIVTLNGARFAPPFIEHHLPGVSFDQLHIDLLYPLRRPGLTRGLKCIETELGLSRSGETTGMLGFDAVQLWYQYKRDSQAAPDKQCNQ